MTAVVLSNQAQYSEWWKAHSDVTGHRVFCDNPSFYGFLEAHNIPFVKLDEFLLRSEWREINSWGCDRAAEWACVSREGRCFDGVDWGECFYYILSYLLIAAVKNYCLAEWIIKEYQPGSVTVFEYSQSLPFPGIYGNVYLNIFLEELARKKTVAVERIPVEGLPTVTYSIPAKQTSFKNRVKGWIGRCYARFMRPQKAVSVLAKGSLMHLAPVIQSLSRKGVAVGIYDAVFQRPVFLFALKNKIPYFTQECFDMETDAEEAEFVAKNAERVHQAIQNFSSRKGLVYRGIDFGKFIIKNIFSDMNDYLQMAATESKKYENILRACPPKAWFIDEDVSPSGAHFAAYYKRKGIGLFCVSHAHYPVDFAVSPENRKYGQSITFVNSEYERSVYEARGWDKSKMLVTGTPRYDRLLQMHRGRKKEKHKSFDLLWCGSSLWMSQPDFPAYLGYHVTNWGEAQIPSLRETLEAIKGYPIRLVVKPHMREDERDWREFFKKENITNEVVIKQQSEDFFKLLLESDALIMSYWSTSLIEARICEKPVLLMDPLRVFQDSAPFIREGYCKIYRDAKSLTRDLPKLLKDKEDGKNNHWKGVEDKDEYYFGKNDSENASRAAEIILRSLRDTDPVHFKSINRTKGAESTYAEAEPPTIRC